MKELTGLMGGKTIDYNYDTVDQLTGVEYTGTGSPRMVGAVVTMRN